MAKRKRGLLPIADDGRGAGPPHHGVASSADVRPAPAKVVVVAPHRGMIFIGAIGDAQLQLTNVRTRERINIPRGYWSLVFDGESGMGTAVRDPYAVETNDEGDTKELETLFAKEVSVPDEVIVDACMDNDVHLHPMPSLMLKRLSSHFLLDGYTIMDATTKEGSRAHYH